MITARYRGGCEFEAPEIAFIWGFWDVRNPNDCCQGRASSKTQCEQIGLIESFHLFLHTCSHWLK